MIETSARALPTGLIPEFISAAQRLLADHRNNIAAWSMQCLLALFNHKSAQPLLDWPSIVPQLLTRAMLPNSNAISSRVLPLLAAITTSFSILPGWQYIQINHSYNLMLL